MFIFKHVICILVYDVMEKYNHRKIPKLSKKKSYFRNNSKDHNQEGILLRKVSEIL